MSKRTVLAKQLRNLKRHRAIELYGRESGPVVCAVCGSKREINYAFLMETDAWPKCHGQPMKVGIDAVKPDNPAVFYEIE